MRPSGNLKVSVSVSVSAVSRGVVPLSYIVGIEVGETFALANSEDDGLFVCL